MSLGADAIADLIAPAPSRPSQGPQAAEPAQPSFQDHVARESGERSSPTEKPSSTDVPDKAKADGEQKVQGGDDAKPIAASSSTQQAAPSQSFLMQLLTAITSAPQAQSAENTATQSPVGDTTSQPDETAPAIAAARTANVKQAAHTPKLLQKLSTATAKQAAARVGEQAEAATAQQASTTAEIAETDAHPTEQPQENVKAPSEVKEVADAGSQATADANQLAALVPPSSQTAPPLSHTIRQASIAIDADETSLKQVAPAQARAPELKEASTPRTQAHETSPHIPQANSTSQTQQNQAPQPQTVATAPVNASAPAHHTSESNALDAGAQRAAPVAAQVGREVIRRFNGDSTHFDLRLDPPELGRVDVRLEVSRDHRVTAVIAADNPQALSELSRGARDLQQSLQQAGFDIADDGISFDLSNQQNAFSQPDQSRNDSVSARAAADISNQTETPLPARPLNVERWRGSRVDLFA